MNSLNRQTIIRLSSTATWTKNIQKMEACVPPKGRQTRAKGRDGTLQRLQSTFLC